MSDPRVGDKSDLLQMQGDKSQDFGGLRNRKRILKDAILGSSNVLHRDNTGDEIVKAGF